MSWTTIVSLPEHKRNELKTIAGDACKSKRERSYALTLLLLGEGVHPRDIAKQLSISENEVWDRRQEWKEEATVYIRRRD